MIQQKPQTLETTYAKPNEKDLLDQILEQTNKKVDAINRFFVDKRVERLEVLLPSYLKGEATRLIERAKVYVANNKKLMDCPDNDLFICILKAAELGLAVDGKLAHIVKFKQQYQLLPDFKGIIAIAKRTQQIRDIYSDVICANDNFDHGIVEGKPLLNHSYDLAKDRGHVIGAYAIVYLPDGSWRYEVMSIKELTRIANLSPAKKEGETVGPWADHENEMRRKTVMRRCLKTYCDNHMVIKAMQAADIEWDQEPVEQPKPQLPTGRHSVSEQPTQETAKPQVRN